MSEQTGADGRSGLRPREYGFVAAVIVAVVVPLVTQAMSDDTAQVTT